MNESNPCNVVLLPKPELSQKAIDLSAQLQTHGSFFTLKDGAFFPHISLYMLQLKIADYGKVKELVGNISRSYKPFHLTAYKYDQNKGFIDAEYEKTTELIQLQEQIIDALNPIRDGMREKDIQRMQEASGIKRKYFEEYGYPNVGELFRPHLTITRFTDEELKNTARLPSPNVFSGVYDKVGFFESGENGTCIRLIADFSL